MSEISGCRWYNPCSWFNSCCGDDEPGPRQPLVSGNDSRDGYRTPTQERRTVTTPGNTPTKSPTVKGEAVETGQQWE
ncbi:MAG: hypothetical protein KFB93_05950 [Simkaniaceae bacterium]|jgi:hypothetical protein|nr:MAG: hypothetical protein KFB93_05950 [Simkaniaceae bacterium]